MKRTNLITSVFIGLLSTLLVTSCDENPEVTSSQDILPEVFRVDIPQAISNSLFVAGGKQAGRTKEDSLQGNEIYGNLNTFIALGESAAEVTEEIIIGLKKYKLDRVLTLSVVSDDDGRVKNLVVVADPEFEGQTWEYQLTVTDAESEGNADGGKAMQIFWNKSRPFKGIAIIKLFNANRRENPDAGEATVRIDYSEEGNLGYDAHMEVRVSGLPLPSPLEDPFAVNALRMFAGKKGDVVDVFGNSNHPNAILLSGSTGFNWAFVASGSDADDIGVAEVGLPPSNLDETDRTVLLKDFSIKNVFISEINAVWPGIDPVLVAGFLKNTEAPGFFSGKTGFISAGTSPGLAWDVFADRINDLTPFNPLEVSNLVVTFK